MNQPHRNIQQLLARHADDRAAAHAPDPEAPAAAALADDGAVLLTLALDGAGGPTARELLARRGRELRLYAHWLPAMLADGALVLVTRLPPGSAYRGACAVTAYELEVARRLLD